MIKYARESRFIQAVDCIIFGFDGDTLKILLIQRGFQPEKGKWSLMGGFVKEDEGIDQCLLKDAAVDHIDEILQPDELIVRIENREGADAVQIAGGQGPD